MERIKVGSVEEAVKVAEKFRKSGRYNWFRGESKDRPLRSSFIRKTEKEQKDALELLGRYEAWIKNTPGLENLALKTDEAIAVAQHYGLFTNFIDFTTRTDIAGFFASEKGGSDRAGDFACIICLDTEDLKQFWQPLPKRMPPPEFLEITVPDLWRLEKQHGCFLYCPYDEIEKIYDFDRIIFPNSHPLRGIQREDIYPSRKSTLEILLDQFFMNEILIGGTERLKSLSFNIVKIESPVDRIDPEVYPNGIPEHPSWAISNLRPWLELYAEQYDAVQTQLVFSIHVPDSQDTPSLVKSISAQLQDDMFTLAGSRNKLIRWEVNLEGNQGLPNDFSLRLAPRLACLWDGLRRLPHRDEDISSSIGMCVAFAMAIGGKFPNLDADLWEKAAKQCLVEPVEVEFGAEDGSYSRGFISSASLATAIRHDFISFISDNWKEHIAGNVHGILQTSYDPRKTFDFNVLAPLFAREIAPYQVLARSTAIFYSPARLVSLGLP